ncbi:hypothetical protein [uncultured Microbacterium sp.]|uniref:hypothetical protein n=1 Tax=uncultured Microbacterium sp. TaxID=191216 RepID=UPI002604CF81|nr:hypothetical protein [uncultured Microbacterium sp.]
MASRPTPLPPRLGPRFAVSAARDAGVTPRRLRAGDLEAPFWGVRAHPFDPPERDGLADADARLLRHRIEAYAERIAPTRFFTGLSALVLWCDMLPVRPCPPLDVGVLAPERTPRARGIRGHQVGRHLATVTECDGLPVTSPASTWATLARDLPWRDLVAVGSLMVTPPRGPGGVIAGPALTTLPALKAVTAAGSRTGVAALRAAVPYVRVGARSRPEVHLFLAILQAGLAEPEFDVPVFDDAAALIGIFDLAYVGERVLVEYQGEYHRMSPTAWAADIRKSERAREAGWTVVQITRADLYPDPGAAVARVRRALSSR